MNRQHDMILSASRAAIWIQPEGLPLIESYVRGRLNPDGGFRGRSPESDLYYTVFGLDCLAALNSPLPVDCVRRYLDATGEGADLDFVHLASGARCWSALSDRPAAGRGRALLRRLDEYRAADGGYHHLDSHAARGTVYGGFIAFQAYGEAGDEIPEPGRLLEGIRSLRTVDGGYANAAGIAMGSASATSAAILLQRWIAGETDESAVRALQACECRSGGYLAFAGAPGPDLLSTATALYALRESGRPPASTTRHGEFVESLWTDSGGFCGHPADPVTDCEYTFYAMLALGSCVSLRGMS
jgi:hypothetical protein